MGVELARMGQSFPSGSQPHPAPPERLHTMPLAACLLCVPAVPLSPLLSLLWLWKADEMDLSHGLPCLQTPARLGQWEAGPMKKVTL